MCVRQSRLLTLFAALVVFLMPATAAASNPAPLTLAQALEIAARQSEQVQAADAGAKAAEAQAREARAAKLPRVELSETFSRTTNPVLVFMNLLGQESFGPANFDPNFLNRPPAFNNFNSKIAVSAPLYTGGRIKAGIAATDAVAAATGADAARTRQQVAHQVVQAYSGAILAAGHLAVAEEALATADAYVKLIEDMRTQGLVVESDVLQAKVARSQVEEMIALARAGLMTARAGLNVAMGAPIDTAHLLPTAFELPPVGGESLDALTQAALASRKDLAAMDRRVEAAGQMATLARGASRPEVGAQAWYEMNKENAPGNDGSNWSVFVGAKWALFDGGANAARAAKAREEQRAATQYNSLMKQAAALEVRQAYYALQASRQRLALASGAVAQSKAALAIVEDRYREGLTTVVELMGAQTALSAARTREVSARRDVLLGQATLDLATGRL